MRPNNSKWFVLTGIAAVIGAVFGLTGARSLSGGASTIIFGAFFVGVVALLVWSLSGNKVGKKAAPAVLADARAMKPAAGTGRIYVVRRGYMGGMVGMKVDIRGIASGQIRMNQFVMAEVLPGTYTIETAMARNGVKPSNAETTVSVASGDVVVILAMLQVKSLHSATTQERILGAEAQSAVAKTKMIEWTSQSGRGTAPDVAPLANQMG